MISASSALFRRSVTVKMIARLIILTTLTCFVQANNFKWTDLRITFKHWDTTKLGYNPDCSDLSAPNAGYCVQPKTVQEAQKAKWEEVSHTCQSDAKYVKFDRE